MCGIIGTIGSQSAIPILVEGLRRLEYRGYDSVGVATLSESGDLRVVKTPGRVEQLSTLIPGETATDCVGIGHSRWATHGPATLENAHPHVGGDGELAVVHNGVIENADELRAQLAVEGYTFQSATDTEVVAHLLHFHVSRGNVSDDASCKEVQEQNELRTRLRAIRRALDELRGSYALVILFRDQPDVLLAARCGSPLLIGAADDGYLIGSDVHAISHRAQRLTRLEDHDLAVVRADSLQILQADFSVSPRVMLSCVDASDDEAELGDFPHFTLKEIHQQPASLHRVLSAANLLVGAQDSGSLSVLPSRILIVACGTSWHAGLYGKYLIEELAGIPVDLEYASEYRYRSAPIQEGTMMIAVSQSGETADTVGALHDFQRSGQPTLAICNVPNSTLAQEADGAIFLNVGQEQGVAATKSYTAQCAVFSRLAVEFGQRRGMLEGRFGCLADDMHRLPELVSQILENGDAVRQLAEQFDDASGFLFVGRCYEYATAMEGALKLKEISYLHAEGHAAGELKHGPLALVDEDTVTVALATPGRAYEKTLSSLQEIRARGGRILAVGGEGDERLAGVADEVFSVPVVDECLQPLLNIIPLQLLAYHIADNRGCDVDRPRNLAKSVTVE